MIGQLQTEYFFGGVTDYTGPNGLNPVMAGPTFASPWRLESVLYERTAVGAMDITLSILYNGILYDIDYVIGSTSKYYVFPNARAPHPIALSEKMKVTFRTMCFPGTHNLVINWSQI
jgi:hypothetical protein